MRLIQWWEGARGMTRGTNEGISGQSHVLKLPLATMIIAVAPVLPQTNSVKNHLLEVAKNHICILQLCTASCHKEKILVQLSGHFLGAQLTEVGPMCVVCCVNSVIATLFSSNCSREQSNYGCERKKKKEWRAPGTGASTLEYNPDLFSVADIVGCNIHWGEGLRIIALPWWSLNSLLDLHLSFIGFSAGHVMATNHRLLTLENRSNKLAGNKMRLCTDRTTETQTTTTLGSNQLNQRIRWGDARNERRGPYLISRWGK